MKKSGFLKYLLWSSIIAIVIFTGSIITLFVYDVTNLPSFAQDLVGRFESLSHEWEMDWNEEALFFSNLDFEVSSMGNKYYHSSEYPLSETQNVIVETDVINADILVETTENPNLSVEIYTTSPDRYQMNQGSSQFVLKEKKKTQIFCFFNCEKQEKSQIIIKVPNNVTEVNLQTINGDLTIHHNGHELQAETVNGMVSLSDSTFHEVELESINGKVKVNNSIAINEMDLSVVNGSMLVNQVESNNFYLETVNGGMTLSGLKGNILDCQTVNGDIELQNVYVREIEVEKVNGNFSLINDDLAYEIQSLKLSGLKKNYEIQAKVLNISYN